MVAMVNMAPCRVLAVPSSPSSPLSVSLLSTTSIPSHASLCGYPSPPLSFQSHPLLCLYPNLPLLPPFFFPPPILASRYSGVPTGSRQALNTVQNEATFNASDRLGNALNGTEAQHPHLPQPRHTHDTTSQQSHVQ